MKSSAKDKVVFVCQSCGSKSSKWSGRCVSCGEWNTIIEEIHREVKQHARVTVAGNKKQPVALQSVTYSKEERIFTNIGELDRVLGGGIMPGSIVLIGGDPGIGKSTLMLQMCASLGTEKTLYVSGEESLTQIRGRAERLEKVPQGIELLPETNVADVIETIRISDAKVVIVDSIQTLYRSEIESAPGSVAQVRECAALLMKTAKETGKPIFLVGHITKEGAIAGPKVLEHIVDSVLQFEGERVYSYRILRAVKNRFGSTNEIGVFEMDERGLVEVLNPSEIFLRERNTSESGSAVSAAMEGTRPILIEVQALVTPTSYGIPQRAATGFDNRRLQMLLAVLEKRLGLRLGQHDVFVNIAGGLRIDDPAIDFAVCAAVVSSLLDKPLPSGVLLLGEVGLTGEIRAVSHADIRVREAEKLGFSSVYVPKPNADKLNGSARKKGAIVPNERIASALIDLVGSLSSRKNYENE